MQKHKTYSEQKSAPIIDWNRIISDLKSGKIQKRTVTGHRTEEFTLIMTNARSWVTCACGNQCAIIPRTPAGRPLDPWLAAAGNYFPEAIEDGESDNYLLAERALKSIEQYSERVIREEILKQNLNNAEV